MSSMDKVRRIELAYKKGKGTIKDLCRDEKITPAYYYYLKKHGPGPRARIKPNKKRTYTKKPKFVDIQMEDSPSRVFVVACSPQDLKQVMENLK